MTGLQITIDSHARAALVPFWCVALDYEPLPPPAGHASWRDWYLSVDVPEAELGDGDCQERIPAPERVRPTTCSQVGPEPKTGKNRIHLDIFLGRELPMPERIEVV